MIVSLAILSVLQADTRIFFLELLEQRCSLDTRMILLGGPDLPTNRHSLSRFAFQMPLDLPMRSVVYYYEDFFKNPKSQIKVLIWWPIW